MVAAVRPVPSGLPSPRSPTLSDAGMILPDDSALRSASPSPQVQRPPSPSSLLYHHSNKSAQTVKLSSPPKGRRGPSPLSDKTLSAQSSRSNLRATSDEERPLQKNGPRNHAMASSPTLQDVSVEDSLANWAGREERRMSSSSSSVDSEDLENIKWPGFDSSNEFDDSGVDLEDEEVRDKFPSDINTDGDLESEHRLNGQDEEDDPYSSAALSRRAEMILANAKKRLNVMEGNLRGARHSLLASPSSFGNLKSGSEVSHQLAISRERDRKLYAGMGPIPPRRPYNASPLSSSNSPGHSRVLSETSVPLPFAPRSINVASANKRSSSAMGVMSGPWSPDDGYGHGRIRESKSHEVMRDHRGSGWVGNEDGETRLRSFSRGSLSPPNTLEPLPEDDTESPDRSSSVTTDLRSQMNELKGRISSLKQRAKEDNLRRRSLQTLRTPSPFTAAEIWYAGAEAYKSSPVAADAGVGYKQNSPTRKKLYGNETSSSSSHKTAAADEPYHGQTKGHAKPRSEYNAVHQESPHEVPKSVPDQEPVQSGYLSEPYPQPDEVLEEYDEVDENDFYSVQEEDVEPAGDSVYEDAVYDMPVAERHEDRVDAFDYEHFFLHSAMGSYSKGSRRSSTSSADSVETTRPVTAYQVSEESDRSLQRLSIHQRNPSVDSVSTVATFATAVEGHADDEDDEDDESNREMDEFSQRILPQSSASQQLAPNRSGRGSPIKINGVHQTARGHSPAGDLVGGLRASKIYSILLEPTSDSEPRLALNEEEKQLIYGLAASLQQMCMNLQTPSASLYERKEWRRRLDAARKMLDDEGLEEDSF